MGLAGQDRSYHSFNSTLLNATFAKNNRFLVGRVRKQQGEILQNY